MAKPQPRITLSESRDIPFNKLVLSQSNVRRIKAGVAIDELAEDIARRTLLQSLTVRAVLDESGAETGMYEVPAGGRRYRALELLVKKKRLARTAPHPLHCAHRWPARGGQPRRERATRPAPSRRSISRFPRITRKGQIRGGDRRRLLRLGQCRAPAAAAARGFLPLSAP